MSGLDNTSYTVRTVATTTTLTNNDSVLLVIGATGAVTVNLPAVATVQPGREYTVYKDAAAQTITIDGSGAETIDGGATTTLATGAIHAKTFITDGVAWFTVTAY
jgi:hypothetical protein